MPRASRASAAAISVPGALIDRLASTRTTLPQRVLVPLLPPVFALAVPLALVGQGAISTSRFPLSVIQRPSGALGCGAVAGWVAASCALAMCARPRASAAAARAKDGFMASPREVQEDCIQASARIGGLSCTGLLVCARVGGTGRQVQIHAGPYRPHRKAPKPGQSAPMTTTTPPDHILILHDDTAIPPPHAPPRPVVPGLAAPGPRRRRAAPRAAPPRHAAAAHHHAPRAQGRGGSHP